MAKSLLVVNDEKNNNFLSLLSFDKGADITKMSDFERFAFVCENLPFMVGSRLRREFVLALYSDLNLEFSESLLSDRGVQKSIWRRINGDSSAEITFVNTYKKPHFIISKQEFGKVFLNCLNEKLRYRAILPETLEELIDSLTGADNICIDMTDFTYSRPDEYHSRLTYNKIYRNEPSQKDEISSLILWITCRVLMRKNIRLYLIVGNNLNETERVLNLLSERRLYPKISLCFANMNTSQSIAEICLLAKEKNISPEIIVSEEIGDFEILKCINSLIYELPLTRVLPCSALSSEEGIGKYIDAFNRALELAGEI